ncbi:MAG: biopolymer transporter ExbD [Nannocystaceae bacterium]
MAGGAIDDDDEITAINVTPLVDVTLVLLIIFMVTTSLISNAEGLQVDKPEAASGAKLDDTSVMIVCAADGTVQVDGQTVEGDEAIVDKLTDKLVEDRNLQGIVQCDEAAQVGQMVHLIDLMRNAGIKKYAIATKKPEAAGG